MYREIGSQEGCRENTRRKKRNKHWADNVDNRLTVCNWKNLEGGGGGWKKNASKRPSLAGKQTVRQNSELATWPGTPSTYTHKPNDHKEQMTSYFSDSRPCFNV
jgi:hypothetical protein